MLDSLITKLAVISGISLTSIATFSHAFLAGGANSNLGYSTYTNGVAQSISHLPYSSQSQAQIENIKGTKDCYSVLNFNSKDFLLACVNKTGGKNLTFYYYQPQQNLTLAEEIISLRGRRQSTVTELTITLKSLSGKEISLKDFSTQTNTPWFFSEWLSKELQLNNLCQQTSLFLQHQGERNQVLVCDWKIERNQQGKEIWKPFNFELHNQAK